MVLPEIERHGTIEAWIIDDTGFPKKGRHSVGVARQYCGQLGKQDNCQVAVTLSLANHPASLPVAYRLYLPKEWVTDRTRRRKAGVPKEITFKTKPAIAVDHLRWACAAGLPRGVVLSEREGNGYRPSLSTRAHNPRRVVIRDLDTAPALERSKHHEEVGGAVALVLVIEADGASRFHRDRHARFGKQLL